ncbi:hypothetical protein GLAREA_08498 [Glarea lozoyensis ATCC 20868]|uniref:Uncharacterized protein n=1 Tax=Glarea lozoyensis (strain ATCC 20868 / MF5171) TaxID=1116229 RepID=S3CFA1_GLAL2|nr:uncharacterized protein GLAREA_08498 [Glarea lozoyensis ATCC 20868]EPE24645.1 hypothetical protein GLAREA_08498 [Glarea lozoyensis ATCC 20868]
MTAYEKATQIQTTRIVADASDTRRIKSTCLSGYKSLNNIHQSCLSSRGLWFDHFTPKKTISATTPQCSTPATLRGCKLAKTVTSNHKFDTPDGYFKDEQMAVEDNSDKGRLSNLGSRRPQASTQVTILRAVGTQTPVMSDTSPHVQVLGLEGENRAAKTSVTLPVNIPEIFNVPD